MYGAFILAWMAIKTVFVGLLWNWLVPDLFGGPEVTFFQALGLVVLGWLLTGGGGGKGWGSHHRKKHWKQKWKQKWQNMSPEQREKMKKFWMDKKCGANSPPWSMEDQNPGETSYTEPSENPESET